MRKAKYGSYVIGLWFVLLIVACHHQKEKIITLQEAEEKVLSLPLTQKINQYIDKFSHGKHGVSILSDSLLKWREDTSSYENPSEEVSNNLSCDELLTQIVQSSNITLIVKPSDCYVVQDRVEKDAIYAGVYTPTEGESKTMVLAWIKYNVREAKLYDITKDPHQPIELDFDKELPVGYDFESQCGANSQRE